MTKKRIEHGIICAWLVLLSFVFAGLLPAARGQQRTEVSDKPAEEVYENIQIFKGRPAADVMRAMVSWNRLLGVDCTHCHVKDQWQKDDKPEKLTARKMFQMTALSNKQLETDQVTCYTCHRGKAKPDPPPDAFKPSPEQVKLGAQDKRPAEQVYKNVQTLRGVPAGRWMSIMMMFSLSLGVDCTYCHVPGEFEKDDKPAKLTARRMLRLTGSIAREIYKGQSPINCYTCHRGQPKPLGMPTEAAK